MKKRVLSVLLCVAMVVGMLPVIETTAKASNELDYDKIVTKLNNYIQELENFKTENNVTEVYWNKGLDEDVLKASDWKSCVTAYPCHDTNSNVTNRYDHNHPTTYATLKTICQSNKISSETYDSNDMQCSGFTSYLWYILFGYTAIADQYYTKYGNSASLDPASVNKGRTNQSVPADFTFHPGDIIRCENGTHSVLVYKIIKAENEGEKDKIRFLECNYPNPGYNGTSTDNCRVSWIREVNIDTAIGWITQNYNYVLVPNYSLRDDTSVSPPTTCTVTFNPGDGTVSPASKTVTVGETYDELPTPTRDGYTFLGWGAAPDSTTYTTAETTVTSSENHTLSPFG